MADTQYEFNLQARNSQVRSSFSPAACTILVCSMVLMLGGMLQGDYSMAIRAVAETLSDYRATNVRAGKAYVLQVASVRYKQRPSQTVTEIVEFLQWGSQSEKSR